MPYMQSLNHPVTAVVSKDPEVQCDSYAFHLQKYLTKDRV